MSGRASDTDTPPGVDWLARVLFAAADDAGIGVMVTAAHEGGLRNLYSSRAADHLHKSALGRDPLSTLAGPDVESGRIADLLRAFVESGVAPASYTAHAIRGDGGARVFDIGLGPLVLDGVPTVVSMLTDVTEFLQQGETLRRSGERFRTVVESIPEAIFVTRGTRVTYANPAFTQAFGVTEDVTRVPLDVLDLVRAEDTGRFQALMAELTPGTHRQGEYQMVSRDGRGLTLELSAMGIDADDPGVLFLGHDATSRRERETQLLQADRVAVLGTLAAGMAHAINNPLSYTLLNLEHVARRMRDLGSDQDYYAEARVRLAEAHDGADRVAKVVKQMRALSRARVTAPGPTDLRAVLDNVLSMIGHEIRYSAQLILRYDPTPLVWVSEGELEQALLGLVLFVARSLPENLQQAREIRVSLGTSAGGDAVLTISDDGVALSHVHGADLTDPFASMASSPGLTMSHAGFSAMGGRLDIDRKPGGGAVFRVVLPAAESRAAESTRLPAPAARAPRPALPVTRARVLVIDDEPGVASTLRAMLEAQHEVTSVESAREGLRLLMGPDEFDVVFCDLVMPEVSGIDVYCALELNRPDRAARLVFMTGGVFTPEAERFLARVQNPRIEKPFSLLRVEQLLAQAVAPRDAQAAEPAP